MGKDHRFRQWVHSIRLLNSDLRGQPAHHDDIRLRSFICNKMDPDLRNRVGKTIHDIVEFKDWVDAIQLIDEQLKSDRKRAREEFEFLWNQKKPCVSETVTRTSSRPPHFSSSSRSAHSAVRTPLTSSLPRLPKLTIEERDFLKQHNGCFKCRRKDAGHISKDCPNPFPNPATYISPLSVVRPKGKPRTVAPIVSDLDSDMEVAAITASSSSSFAADTSGERTVDNEVSYKSPHLRWSCVLLNDSSPSPASIRALIDTGSHLTLIHPSLVHSLQLKHHTLAKPETISVAVTNVAKITLHEFVYISPMSQYNNFVSRPVKALIAPHLCSKLILGLPFLVANQIVIDTSAGTAISKGDSIDLLTTDSCPTRQRPFLPKSLKKQQLARVIHCKKAVFNELLLRCNRRKLKLDRQGKRTQSRYNVIGVLKERVELLHQLDSLALLDQEFRQQFSCVFQPIPHAAQLPTQVTARIQLKEAFDAFKTRSYSCPRKYRDAWQILVNEHLQAGRIRPSSSSIASPAFLISKADKQALPRWVNDYRELNKRTIADVFPLPRCDEILKDCARGRLWATLDMTNAFFQTPMHPDDVHLTAVTTPIGLYEWLVMPMGLRNAPAIQQRRLTAALLPYIGSICHVYLDDIVIWSDSLEQHKTNVALILQALQDNKLFCNPKKMSLFASTISFLGHRISSRGLEADQSKVTRIQNWPVPTNIKSMRGFLGLVRYIGQYVSNISTELALLQRLTTKDCEKEFPPWTSSYQTAFDRIKTAVQEHQCLTTIDYSSMPANSVFITTDASDTGTGAILSFGPTWATARPVALDSMTLKGAELHYPVHEKELLAIIRALKKWRPDLLGYHFTIFTDHRTLENFMTQKDLSRRQARWLEFLSQFDFDIKYIKGSDNIHADILSRVPTYAPHLSPHDGFSWEQDDCVAVVSSPSPLAASRALAARSPDPSRLSLDISFDRHLLDDIQNGYSQDSWCSKLSDACRGMKNITYTNGLWYANERLIIPRVGSLRATLFRLAHDVLGHMGVDKSYDHLRRSFYWPGMRSELADLYVKGCAECQRNKSGLKEQGPLHPLPVPDDRFQSIALDFVGPLPTENGFDALLTITDRLGADLKLIPCTTRSTASEIAQLFFDHWYCDHGLPANIISDRDKLFLSDFWRSLHRLTRVDLHFSTAFHPQTDGSSERTNKTVIQCLRFLVDRQQKGWVQALPRIRFALMLSKNKSTGFSGFELLNGYCPRLIPHFSSARPSPPEVTSFLHKLSRDVQDARDNLLRAKIDQAASVNRSRQRVPHPQVGSLVLLSTVNRRKEYKTQGANRVAKFIPRFDGPWKVLAVNHDNSTVVLDLPKNFRGLRRFHFSLLRTFTPNDDSLFPARAHRPPPSVWTELGEEFVIDQILDERFRHNKSEYLVRWLGEGPEADLWLPRAEIEDTMALEDWLNRHRLTIRLPARKP